MGGVGSLWRRGLDIAAGSCFGSDFTFDVGVSSVPFPLLEVASLLTAVEFFCLLLPARLSPSATNLFLPLPAAALFNLVL